MAKLSDRQITARYRLSHGEKFVEALDQINASVPEKFEYQGLTFTHMGVYYDAPVKKFYYFNAKKTVYLSKEDLHELQTNPLFEIPHNSFEFN